MQYRTLQANHLVLLEPFHSGFKLPHRYRLINVLSVLLIHEAGEELGNPNDFSKGCIGRGLVEIHEL